MLIRGQIASVLLGHVGLLHRASSHHHVIPPVIIDSLTGFLAGNEDYGNAL
jgi:hypothetical protein